MPLPAPLHRRQVRARSVLGALSQWGHLRCLPLWYGLQFSHQDCSWPLDPSPPIHRPHLRQILSLCPTLRHFCVPSCLLSTPLCPIPLLPASHLGPSSPVPLQEGQVVQWATGLLTHPLPPGMPTCRCPTGFTGPKCTQQVCAGYCANNSTCTVNQGNQPQCRCLPGFLGDRCQYRESAVPGTQGRNEGSWGT